MSQNPFLESLTLTNELRSNQPSQAYVHPEYVAYHGSPFSKETMSLVFQRAGLSDMWGIIPTQPYHINEDGSGTEPFGDGPSVSAGSWKSARMRAFLNKHADHFIGVDKSAGFSSAGVLDSMMRPIVTVPWAYAERLAKAQPEGQMYTVDIGADGFRPQNYESDTDLARDRYEHRSPHIIYPCDWYTMSFAEFIAGTEIIVVDNHFSEVKAAEQHITDLREKNGDYHSVQGEQAMLEHFSGRGLTARFLSEM